MNVTVSWLNWVAENAENSFKQPKRPEEIGKIGYVTNVRGYPRRRLISQDNGNIECWVLPKIMRTNKHIVEFDIKRAICAYLSHFVVIYASLYGLMSTPKRIGRIKEEKNKWISPSDLTSETCKEKPIYFIYFFRCRLSEHHAKKKAEKRNNSPA